MKRWEVWINHIGMLPVAASGVIYGVMKYFLAGRDADSRLGSPWQPDVLKVHLLAAPLLVFGIGLIYRTHGLVRLRSGERGGRRTGVILLLGAAPLIISGYVLPVLTGDIARRWVGWLHAAFGVVIALTYTLHLWRSASAGEGEDSG